MFVPPRGGFLLGGFLLGGGDYIYIYIYVIYIYIYMYVLSLFIACFRGWGGPGQDAADMPQLGLLLVTRGNPIHIYTYIYIYKQMISIR